MWEIPGISLHCNNLLLNVFNSIKKMYFIDCQQLIETMMNIVGIDGQIFKVYLNVLSKIRVLTIFSINHKPQPTKTTVRSENCGLVCCYCCCDERREMWVCCEGPTGWMRERGGRATLRQRTSSSLTRWDAQISLLRFIIARQLSPTNSIYHHSQ